MAENKTALKPGDRLQVRETFWTGSPFNISGQMEFVFGSTIVLGNRDPEFLDWIIQSALTSENHPIDARGQYLQDTEINLYCEKVS